MTAQTTLLAVAVWVAWRPAEIHASTPLVVAAAALGLVPWAWRRRAETGIHVPAILLLAGLLVVSGLSGADPSGAMRSGALVAALAALGWCASRERPDRWAITGLALGIAALGLAALWQVVAGLDRAAAELGSLPEGLQEDAAARLAEGRAFATMVVPGHLAVVMAMALPVLVEALRERRWRLPAAAGIVTATTGVVLSRSPLGAGLAALAVLAVLLARHRRAALGAAVLGLVAVVGISVARTDLGRLEPLRLRAENWRVAAWVWSTAPVAGVGFGGYGQASLAVPFPTENLPSHAHCLPLEWLAELGVAGAALLVLAAAGLGGAVRRCWRDRPGLAAAVAVVPLHNLADFSLWTSGVAIPWAVLLGWAVSRPPAPLPTEGPVGRRRAAAFGLAAAAVVAGVLHLTSSEVGRAAAAAEGPAARVETWRRAHQLAPWRVGPLVSLGAAALEADRPDLADLALAELDRWRWLRPRSASLASLASQLELMTGELQAAVIEAWTAHRARPMDGRLREQADRLLTAAEDAGAADR